jgi:hypothetical protein
MNESGDVWIKLFTTGGGTLHTRREVTTVKNFIELRHGHERGALHEVFRSGASEWICDDDTKAKGKEEK